MDTRRAYTLRDHRERQADRYASVKFQTLARHIGNGGQRILNVGCGSGEANIWLARRGHRVDACDPDAAAVAMSRALAAEHEVATVTVIPDTLADLAGAAAYDAVVMLDVLEHLEDDEAAVRKVHGLLRPGGLALISVPALPSLFGHHDVMLGHHRRYTRRSLRALLAPLFDVHLVRYFGFSLIPIAVAFSVVLRQSYPIASTSRVGLVTRLLDAVLSVEARVSPPVGTSLLFVGRRSSR